MATHKDGQVMQATMLYKLLKLLYRSENETLSTADLRDIIGELVASMSEDEVAHVEAQVKKYSK